MSGRLILTEKQANIFNTEVKERSDRLMDYFLAGHFIIGLVFAFFYGTWFIALGVGSLCLVAYYSVKVILPGSALYQYVLSAVLGVFMAQYIYQMHGLFEMHFFAFIGSALLITYQKWRLQLPMLIVVFIHHAAFSYLQNTGFTKIYFTQIDSFDLQTLVIHIALVSVIFFICGLWSHQLKQNSKKQIEQTLQMAELQKELQLSAERKTKERALEERNEILESIGDAFFAVDKNWVVTYWNKMAEKTLKMKKKEIIGKNLWETYPGAINSPFYSPFENAMKRNVRQHFEASYHDANDWYETSIYPSDNGLSVYIKDVSERKASIRKMQELNEELREKAKDLEFSNAELEQFAYVASHDLQEPLRMVTSFMGQLERKYSDIIDEKGKQYIHYAVDGGKRMRQIILDLLDYSRVGRSGDKMEPVDLNELMREISVLYRKQVKETQAIIKYGDLPIINTIKGPIRQVFQNLTGNALKYQNSMNAPLIKISAAELQTHWYFSVADNGIGIDESSFDNIFIIFQRLHDKSEYPGTGMGLAITKKIIETMGGKIWVTSKQGGGSTFHFTILKEKTAGLIAA